MLNFNPYAPLTLMLNYNPYGPPDPNPNAELQPLRPPPDPNPNAELRPLHYLNPNSDPKSSHMNLLVSLSAWAELVWRCRLEVTQTVTLSSIPRSSAVSRNKM